MKKIQLRGRTKTIKMLVQTAAAHFRAQLTSEFCVFYTSKCIATEIQLKKAIFMIRFRQVFARTNSTFIKTFIENMHYCLI